MDRRLMLGSAVVAAALIAGCCSRSSPAALPAITVPSASTSGLASSAATASASDSASASVSPSASPSASPTGPPGNSTNLTVDDSVRSDLLTAFRATKQPPTSVFTGPTAGSVYYAYLAPTKTYWAIARFDLGPGSTTAQQVSMQDAGSSSLFSHPVGQPWKATGYAGGAGPYPCTGDLDPELLTLWHMTIDPNCPLASGRAPRAGDNVTFVNEPGSDAPSGSYQGLIDLQEVQLAGTGDIWLDAETVTPPAAPVNTKPSRILDINITKATRTEYSVGSDAASSHVVEGSYDAAFGKRVAADFTSSSVTFIVTVSGGNATLVQEVSGVTPTGSMTYDEP